jgi:hypothetical protein
MALNDGRRPNLGVLFAGGNVDIVAPVFGQPTRDLLHALVNQILFFLFSHDNPPKISKSKIESTGG